MAAHNQAIENGNPELNNLHVLSALVKQQDGLVGSLLDRLNVNRSALTAKIDQAVENLPKVSGNGEIYNSREFSQLLIAAAKKAEEMHDEYISVEHLFLALLDGGGKAAEILKDQKITVENVLQMLQTIRGNQRVTSADPEATFEALEKYGRGPWLRLQHSYRRCQKMCMSSRALCTS